MAGRNLKECIEVIEGRYDYVVIDCSQNVTTIDVNVLVASDFRTDSCQMWIKFNGRLF